MLSQLGARNAHFPDRIVEGSRLRLPEASRTPAGAASSTPIKFFLRPRQNSKLKTLIPPWREPPSCDLALFFGEESVPDLSVLGLVAVVLQLRHLATDLN